MTALRHPPGTNCSFHLETSLQVITIRANHHADGIELFVVKADTALLLSRWQGMF